MPTKRIKSSRHIAVPVDYTELLLTCAAIVADMYIKRDLESNRVSISWLYRSRASPPIVLSFPFHPDLNLGPKVDTSLNEAHQSTYSFPHWIISKMWEHHDRLDKIARSPLLQSLDYIAARYNHCIYT
jgi:hypothetical protein